nr:sigma factor-like helix-turn-helix DNA-binding protein [uncultured Acetatifactor sp.]
MGQVTREQLESYRSMKREMMELKYKLASLGEGDSMLGSSVIKDYRKGYPVPQAVVGVDWERYEWQKEHCERRIQELQKKCDAIERYVEEDIEDSLTRRIFRMYFLEGRTQKEIGKIIHMDRSTVSRKLNAPAR